MLQVVKRAISFFLWVLVGCIVLPCVLVANTFATKLFEKAGVK